MISVDTNILFVALEKSRPGHARARRFLNDHRSNPELAICELALLELYVLLRNPAVARRPLEPVAATSVIHKLRANPKWNILDYPGSGSGIMEELWQWAGSAEFPRRKVFDARLALTLRHHGVTELTTVNAKDFEGFGFARIWNPLEEPRST